MAVLEWLISSTGIGVVALGVFAYGVSWAIRKVFPKAPDPIFVAIPIGLIGALTLPSIPRYKFEREILSQIAKSKPWIRVTNRTYWADLTEPITLIKAPIGSVTIVMPDDIHQTTFREVIVRYSKEPIVSIVDPDCTEFTITYSQPDDQGIFRIMPRHSMDDREKDTYCKYDWSRERRKFRQEMLRQIDEQDSQKK